MTIKAVLLDLDNTLLAGSSDPATTTRLIQLMTDHLQQALNIPSAREAFRAARVSLQPIDPLRLNADAFREAFVKALNHQVSGAELDAIWDDFYQNRYDEIQALTKPVSVTNPLLAWLRQQDYAVVIATNPLYSASVIDMRLQWAGIDPNWGFARITHAENSHFIKPQPQYYEEIMAHIGIEPYEAIMVGDDWENDIIPAASVGMRTFWITDELYQAAIDVPDSAGSLADFYSCLVDENWLDALPSKTLIREHIIPRLQGNVGALMGLIETIPERFWNQRPDPQEWTPLEIVKHLVESEVDVQRPRLQTIAVEDNPFLKAAAQPPQPGTRDLSTIDGRATAIEFAAERDKTIAWLQDLPNDAWKRPARHSIYGPTSLVEMAAFTARHDQLHIQQLCQTLGKCE